MLIAASLVIGAHLVSHHSPDCHTAQGRCVAYENINPGLYLRADSGLTVGGYRNSYGRASTYAGWTFETRDGRFALTVAGATGYPRANVIPLAVPSMRFSLVDRWALRIAGAPKFEKGGAAVLHIAIERRFQ